MDNISSNFSQWIQLADRTEIGFGLNSQGIYILKNSEQNADPIFNSLKDPLLYIGETCGQTFKERLYQLHRSATRGVKGHSGGRNFFNIYNLIEIPNWLYVAILPIVLEQPERSAYIRYLERYLIWQYVRIHNVLPLCNLM